MQKKLLVLAVPSLLTTMVVSSCGGSSSSIVPSTIPNSSNQPLSSTSTTTTPPTSSVIVPDKYTYGKVETMAGKFSIKLMNGLIQSDIPVVLNYQVANEEFSLDKFAEYVKFSMNIELANSSTGAVDMFMIIAQLFPTFISDFAYQSFITPDYTNAIDNIELNYNADGMLYVSFLDSEVIEGEEVITNMGTTCLDVYKLIGSLVTDIAARFANGITLESLQGLSVDFGIIMPVISALAVSFENSGFNLKIGEEGAKAITGALAGVVESAMPSMGEMMAEIFDLSSIVISYTETSNEVNFAMNHFETAYTATDGTEWIVEKPIVAFNIKDAETDQSEVFSGFDYLDAYNDQQDILNKVAPIVAVYDNMYYTAAYQTTIEEAIAELDTLKEDENFSLIANIGNENCLEITTTMVGETEKPTFEKYLQGLKAVNDLFAQIETLGLNIASVEAWTMDSWLSLAKYIDKLIGTEIDPRGDILSKSDKATEGAAIVAAYKKALSKDIEVLKVKIGEMFGAMAVDLKPTMWGTISMTTSKACDYATQLQQLIFSLKNGLTLATMPSTYSAILSEIITDDEAILIGQLCQFMNSDLTAKYDELDADEAKTFVDVKEVVETYILSTYGVESETMSALELIGSNRSNTINNYLATLGSYQTVVSDFRNVSRSWVATRNKLISGTTSVLYKTVVEEVEAVCTDEMIEAATTSEVLNGYKTALETKYVDYKIILENVNLASSVSATKSYYDAKIAAIEAKLASLTQAA